jgi:hypothetical protein
MTRLEHVHEWPGRQVGGGTLTHKRRSSGQPSCTFRLASSSGLPHPGQTTPAAPWATGDGPPVVLDRVAIGQALLWTRSAVAVGVSAPTLR